MRVSMRGQGKVDQGFSVLPKRIPLARSHALREIQARMFHPALAACRRLRSRAGHGYAGQMRQGIASREDKKRRVATVNADQEISPAGGTREGDHVSWWRATSMFLLGVATKLGGAESAWFDHCGHAIGWLMVRPSYFRSVRRPYLVARLEAATSTQGRCLARANLVLNSMLTGAEGAVRSVGIISSVIALPAVALPIGAAAFGVGGAAVLLALPAIPGLIRAGIASAKDRNTKGGDASHCKPSQRCVYHGLDSDVPAHIVRGTWDLAAGKDPSERRASPGNSTRLHDAGRPGTRVPSANQVPGPAYAEASSRRAVSPGARELA